MSLLPSIHARLRQAQERHEEIARLLGTPEIAVEVGDQRKFAIVKAVSENVNFDDLFRWIED